MAIYAVDSNFFIQAHRDYYPLDVAIGFWNRVKELAHSGMMISIDKVKGELYKNKDELTDWCQGNLAEDFFTAWSSALPEYQRACEWASSRSDHYLRKAIDNFLDHSRADAFLVAFTLADKDNRVLVTQEVSNPHCKNQIKIPEPCKHFGVTYINTVDMFRQLGIRF